MAEEKKKTFLEKYGWIFAVIFAVAVVFVVASGKLWTPSAPATPMISSP
tara:strand:- start:1236 stop:1382 length:147 start_codon:yes stop_codon:yes gene_type:complete